MSGIILCGGKSSRYQKNKIKIKINSTPLFIDQIFKLSFFCDEILIASSLKSYKIILNEIERIDGYLKYYEEFEIKMPSIKIVMDNVLLTDNNSKSIGPIVGIYSGLLETKNKYSIVQAFDMPFTSYNLFKLLIGKNIYGCSDLVMIKTCYGIEALSAIYSKNCIETLWKNINNKIYKITEILPYLRVNWIFENDLKKNGVDDLNFFNVNTIEDKNNFEDIWTGEYFLNSKRKIKNNSCKSWESFFYRKDNKLLVNGKMKAL